MRKKLAFDFDDVLCDTTKAFLAFNKKKYGNTVLYSAARTELYKSLKISEEEENKRWTEFFKDSEFCYPRPAKNLLAILKRMKKEYSLIVISARDRQWQYQVKPWIKKYTPNIFEKVVFIHSQRIKKSKGMVCKKNKTVALIEDEPEHVRSCIAYKMPVVVFDRPWNQKVKKNIPRIKTISQLKSTLLLIGA